MDFGAEVAGRSYQEIPTGALRPRNDILGSAFERNVKLKFDFQKLKATDMTPSPFAYAGVAAFSGRIGARVEMACL